MPEAKLVLPDGTQVTVNGTSEEVARALALYANQISTVSQVPSVRRDSKLNFKAAVSKNSKMGPQAQILKLRDEGFFNQKRTVSDVQKKLEEAGFIYALDSVAVPLLRLRRQNQIRRIKEKNGYVYVYP